MVVPEFLDVLGVVEESIREMEARQPEVVEIGDFVLALFPEDGAYYRAGSIICRQSPSQTFHSLMIIH